MLRLGVVQGKPNPLHVGFPQRLRKARRKVGFSRAALSVEAGLAQNTAYGLESGERIPRLDTVERLAVALELSPCALAFGIEQTCNSADGGGSTDLPTRVKDMRVARGLSLRELGRLSSTSTNLVRMTETGATMPNLANLEALATALEVSPCWLAFGVEPQKFETRRRSRSFAQSLEHA